MNSSHEGLSTIMKTFLERLVTIEAVKNMSLANYLPKVFSKKITRKIIQVYFSQSMEPICLPVSDVIFSDGRSG